MKPVGENVQRPAGRLTEPADMQQLYRSLFSSPDLLPWQLDVPQRRLLLARLDEPAYRQAVFLDQRLNKDGGLQAVWAPLDNILAQFDASKPPARSTCFLFHVGHCGSTLISKLLAHNPALLPVREPLSLRTLASAQRLLGQRQSFLSDAGWDDLLHLLLQLLSRAYAPEQHALVKASSSCSPLVSPVLRADDRHRAILLYTDLDTYLAGVLRPQSRDALYNFAQERIVDLQHIAGKHTPYLHELSPAGLGALNWCTSMAEFVRVSTDDALHTRALLVNFEEFLRSRSATLQTLFSFLGIETSPGEMQALLSDTDYLRTYAKDARFDYTPELRAADLGSSLKTHAQEIAEAKQWLTGLAAKVPALMPLMPLMTVQAPAG